ncbi:lysophospholipid acyltransferase family protein [Phycisphaera mikurensis]|uniref:Putative acyltransferase n=1 Tax=Phycisphaera mikurensis (strain NBRC 102666 / KCTC 22515 / FYK2301M01) TaxID=1142394 RepID=I0IJ06_PHYMF|nr:lysophospholipid acyltransferase family protein [Phycisphaera mikurensis]MBB6443091.1 KDO2-lipid IV(A) lauroyltransferase [Phycisphaera mikurensis]BAM05244.1 putative acyltransferase [Phycisphaera mikurensis NBRC 102666]
MAAEPAAGDAGGAGVHGRAADACLRLLFGANAAFPGLLAAVERPLLLGSRVAFRGPLRGGVVANAPFLLGPDATRAARRRLADDVLRSFYRFIREVGAAGRAEPEALRAQVAAVRGREHHAAARASGGGIVFATAHLGSFEVGIAALRGLEPDVHVVFQRDPFAAFDAARARLHRRLGVHDAVVGGPDSLDVWTALRARLEAGAAVLCQADRVMPGQRGVRVPFLGGTAELPVGPVKLAAMAGAAIVPVFAVRTPGGVELRLHRPIRVAGGAAFPRPGAPGEAMLRLAAALAAEIGENPGQWLELSPRFEAAGGRADPAHRVPTLPPARPDR